MKSPWADFFEFSRREQIGVLILIGIIASCMLVLTFYHDLFPRAEEDYSAKEKELIAEIQKVRPKKEFTSSKKYAAPKPKASELFDFDPNTLGLAGYVKLGFSEKQAQSILNYLDKGGEIRKVEDFKKLYVVDDYMYDRLKDHIHIEQKASSYGSHRYEKAENDSSDENGFEELEAPVQTLDLNTATSEELQDLRGIGPIYAKRILSYRDLLGGYSSVDQIAEVYGLRDNPELVKLVRPQLKVEEIPLEQIDVNSAEWKDLVRHPYIDKKVANSILAIRKTHGRYAHIEDLKKSHLIDDSLYIKISPYLSVGNQSESTEPSD